MGAVDSNDEIGQLAGHLDHLLDAIDVKVAERTRELEASHASLKSAQQRLVRAEKLAAVGRLTAGIAHELNNPIAVIQGNLDLVRELLGADARRVGAELQLADEQIERMRLIVTQLLQFARPTEFAGYVANVDVSEVLEESLMLVGHLLAATRIEVERDVRQRPHGRHQPTGAAPGARERTGQRDPRDARWRNADAVHSRLGRRRDRGIRSRTAAPA